MFIFNHYITFTETSTSRRESRRYNNNWISQNLLKSTEICVAITKPVRVWDGLPSWHQCLKNLPAIAGDLGSIPGSGRSHGGGHGNPPQYSCLKNPMDRGAWRATVQGVTKSRHDWSSLAHTRSECEIRRLSSTLSTKQISLIAQRKKKLLLILCSLSLNIIGL